MNPRIIFMGTPLYAVPFLEGLVAAGMKPVAVVSQPDKPVGRKQVFEPTAVKAAAEKHSIPILQPQKIRDEEWVEKIRELAPDLIVVVAFGQIIPKSILDIPRYGCVNVHPSLLPRHRGAAPLQETILSGDTESAVTIMLMDEQMDHGPVLRQERFDVDPAETYDSLRKKTTRIGVSLLIVTLHDLLAGAIEPQEQDHAKATYTRLLTRDAGKIDWSEDALTIERKVRALNPWPGVWTEWNGKRLKILRARLFSLEPLPHTSVFEILTPHTDPVLVAHCNPGALIIDEIQPEGKTPMDGLSFARGYLH